MFPNFEIFKYFELLIANLLLPYGARHGFQIIVCFFSYIKRTISGHTLIFPMFFFHLYTSNERNKRRTLCNDFVYGYPCFVRHESDDRENDKTRENARATVKHWQKAGVPVWEMIINCVFILIWTSVIGFYYSYYNVNYEITKPAKMFVLLLSTGKGRASLE